MSEFTKQASDQITVLIDFTAQLGPDTIASITSVAATDATTQANVTAAVVVSSAIATQPTQVSLTLHGGTAGEYIVLETVILSVGGHTFTDYSLLTILDPLNLTTLAAVRSWIGITSTDDDQNIVACISAASLYWLWRTGRLPANGDIPTQSPLVVPIAFNEWYSGNGSFQMFLRQTPIQSVQALTIGNVAMNQSTAFGVMGWAISGDGKSLQLRPGSGGFADLNAFGMWSTFGGPRFVKGILNINVQYTAGFHGTPADIQLACTQMVALNY